MLLYFVKLFWWVKFEFNEAFGGGRGASIVVHSAMLLCKVYQQAQIMVFYMHFLEKRLLAFIFVWLYTVISSTNIIGSCMQLLRNSLFYLQI